MKAMTIRKIMIGMFVMGFIGFILVDMLLDSPYINAIYFGVLFCIICMVGCYCCDYVNKHDMFKEVLGETLYNIIMPDEDEEDF